MIVSAAPTSAGMRQPYPGLRSFRQDESALFFGREIQVRQLRDILAERNLVVVLGGSGSGKSSLVRAGLLPKLNSTAPIPKRSGAWYVVEFRPRTDPAEELFEAIYQQVFLPLIAPPADLQGSANSDEDPVERKRRFQAVSTALKLDPPLQADDNAQIRCKERLRAALFTGGEFDVGGLFELADETIVTLDERLADAPRSGRANLLLLIDQFEEVFSLPTERSEQGLNLVMSLVTAIQTYRPFNLFLIVTMRNEWLHRCSEFPGVAEAMNGSTYLVDLLAGPEIEKVIVEPARSVLRASGLEVGKVPGPFAPDVIEAVRKAFDEETTVAHAPDQLPLLQHLLPLVWDEAVRDWSAHPSIERRHLEAVPGWKKSRNPLSVCLNAHANSVLNQAIAAAREKAPILRGQDARQLLRVAFSSLAVLDDKGIVRRRFATVDQILSMAGIAERNPNAMEQLRAGLRAALAQFEKASLIDCHPMADGDLFDINHEALVRNWNTYREWVERARNLESRLIALDQKSRSSSAPQSAFHARLAEGVQDLFTAATLRSAAEQVGTDAIEDLLQDVFGPEATFSRKWMRSLLTTDGGIADIGMIQRSEVIHKKVLAANRYRNNFWDRFRPLTALGCFTLACILLVGAIIVSDYNQRKHQEENTVKLINLQRILNPNRTSEGPDAPLTSGSPTTYAAETYAGYNIGAALVEDNSLEDYLRRPVADAVFAGDRLVRSQLSSAVWLRTGGMSPPNNGPQPLDNEHYTKDARCVDPGTKIPLRAANGISWSPRGPAGDRWYPAWENPNEKNGFEVSPSSEGDEMPPGSVFCTSPDGKWQLVWFAEKPPPETDQSRRGRRRISAAGWPLIRNIEWISRNSDRKTKYLIRIEDPGRTFADELSKKLFHPEGPGLSGGPDLYSAFEYVSNAVREDKGGNSKIVKFERDGHWAGFSVILQNKDKITLWTAVGLNEPEEVTPEQGANVRLNLRTCEPKPTERFGCDLGQMKIAESSYRVVLSWLPKREPCDAPSSICLVWVTVYFADGRPRASLVRPESTIIKKGAITEDGHLLLLDDSGQVWRYLIDPGQLRALHKDSLRELPLNQVKWSEPCKELECAKQLPVVNAAAGAQAQR